jgi:hypothetical protein
MKIEFFLKHTYPLIYISFITIININNKMDIANQKRFDVIAEAIAQLSPQVGAKLKEALQLINDKEMIFRENQQLHKDEIDILLTNHIQSETNRLNTIKKRLQERKIKRESAYKSIPSNNINLRKRVQIISPFKPLFKVPISQRVEGIYIDKNQPPEPFQFQSSCKPEPFQFHFQENFKPIDETNKSCMSCVNTPTNSPNTYYDDSSDDEIVEFKTPNLHWRNYIDQSLDDESSSNESDGYSSPDSIDEIRPIAKRARFETSKRNLSILDRPIKPHKKDMDIPIIINPLIVENPKEQLHRELLAKCAIKEYKDICTKINKCLQNKIEKQLERGRELNKAHNELPITTNYTLSLPKLTYESQTTGDILNIQPLIEFPKTILSLDTNKSYSVDIGGITYTPFSPLTPLAPLSPTPVPVEIKSFVDEFNANHSAPPLVIDDIKIDENKETKVIKVDEPPSNPESPVNVPAPTPQVATTSWFSLF